MKRLFILSASFFFVCAAMAQPKADDVIKMNVEKHDFGKILQNAPVTYFFEIKNISNNPVVVENSWASCGCTTPDRIVDPILPGTTAKLKVQYNAAALGTFTKEVFVKIAGIEGPKTVQITGEVLTPEAYDAYKKTKKDGTVQTPSTEAKIISKETQPAKPATHKLVNN